MADLEEIEIIKTLPQPFGFYRVLSGTNYLHFGFFPDEKPLLNLKEAQHIASEKIIEHLPPAPARILDVGCGLGTTAGELVEKGYEVVAIAPLEEPITFAQQHHCGATFVCCGFLDEHFLLSSPQQYDVILSQESLQYFPDINAVFKKAKSLLTPNGRFILCDEVSYHSKTKQLSAVHEAKEIEKALSAQGFYITNHEYWGKNVTPTCQYAVEGFQQNRALLVEIFGEQSNQIVDHFLEGWQQQLEWYSNGTFGYECWVLSPSEFQICTYQSGDENSILETFNEVFKTQRTLEHWQWKYLGNPYGKTWISAVWHQNKIVAQYAGYPVSLYFKNETHLTCHAADVFSVPKYRRVGHGETALMSRAFRYYERLYLENSVVFAYGFAVNAGTHQRLGELFWKYNVPVPIYQRILEEKQISQHRNMKTWFFQLKGYKVEKATKTGEWANDLFEKVKDNYGWLLVRDQMYLKWRYEQHPDFNHEFWVVYYWGKPIGWIAGRLENQRWLLGDALFDPQYAQIGFQLILNKLSKEYPQIQQIDSWCSEVPLWWNQILDELGFIKQRQFQHLDLIDKIYLGEMSHAELAQNFYFTWGDSDLY